MEPQRQAKPPTLPMRIRGLFHAYAFPKGDAALDLAGRRQRGGVVPCCARIAFASDDDVVIIGDALPDANGGLGDRFEILLVHRFNREVLIPFHYDAVVTLGDYGSFPSCFRHSLSIISSIAEELFEQ